MVINSGNAILEKNFFYGKTFDAHTPLLNFLSTFVIFLTGKTSNVLLYMRVIVFGIICLTLLYIFKISYYLKSKEVGLFAVLLCITSFPFVGKAFEIRHDVLNIFFNTVSVWNLILYFDSKKDKYFIFSALLSGLALATTQKAVIGILGIVCVLFYFLYKNHSFKQVFKSILTYIFFLALPSLLSFSLILLFTKDTLADILKATVIQHLHFVDSTKSPVLPFYFTKIDMLKPLIYNNGYFYILCLVSVFYYTKKKFKDNEKYLLITSWVLFSLLFYLWVKRPFYQSFITLIPGVSILVSCFIADMTKNVSLKINEKKISVIFIISFLLTVNPSYHLNIKFSHYLWTHRKKIPEYKEKNFNNKKQLINAEFCARNLKRGEKVLCWTDQQLFYEPVLNFWVPTDCGENIKEIDPKLLKEKLKKLQCTVAIFDWRTKLLSKSVKSEIEKYYVYSGVGDIYIPGFIIPPKTKVKKNILISGHYFFPKDFFIKTGTVFLEPKEYEFENKTDTLAVVSYAF